jgi:hypothetical protein
MSWKPSIRRVAEFSRQFVEDAENPLISEPKPPDHKEVQANAESCRDRKRHPSAPQQGSAANSRRTPHRQNFHPILAPRCRAL